MRALKVGDVVLIRGEMFTGRDAVHAYLMKNPPPVDLHGAVLYHCGPVMLKQGERVDREGGRPDHEHSRRAVSGRLIRKLRRSRRDRQGRHGYENACGACKECGAVYLNAIGGAAQYYARTVEKVLGVHLMEFGIPEAMWHLRVKDFVAIVTMDAHGNSLHAGCGEGTAANWSNSSPL